LRIQVRSQDDIRVCSVAGELDAYTAPELRDALDAVLAEGQATIIVDLRELTYLDSTGLGILVGTAKKARHAGGDLAVCCTRPNLLKIFQISGTHEILNLQPTLDEAAERIRQLRDSRGQSEGDAPGKGS